MVTNRGKDANIIDKKRPPDIYTSSQIEIYLINYVLHHIEYRCYVDLNENRKVNKIHPRWMRVKMKSVYKQATLFWKWKLPAVINNYKDYTKPKH